MPEFFDAKTFIYERSKLFSVLLSLPDFKVIESEGVGEDANCLSDLSVFSLQDQENIAGLIAWVQEKLNNGNKGAVKITFAHEAKTKQTDSCNFIVNIYMQAHHPEKLNLYVSGCSHQLSNGSGNIFIYQKQNGRDDFSITYVLNSFNFDVILKNKAYDVLKFLIQGFTSKEIGGFLHLSEHTVNDYKKSLYQQFNAHNSYQLIAHAKEKEII